MSETGPSVSVIIPTFNRPAQLRECVLALSRSSLPFARFEVVVVDDGSAVPLHRALSDIPGLDIRSIRQANAGPAAARNAGAAAARAPFLAFTDDDCQPAATWLEVLLRAHVAAPAAALGGRTINALSENVFSDTSQLLLQYMYDRLNRDPGAAAFFASNNFAVPREGYLALGGFDRGFPRAAGEDRDFCARWSGSGRALSYCPEAEVLHAHRLDLVTFLRQHFAYGRGAHRFRTRAAPAQGGALRFERLDFYTGIFAVPFTTPGARKTGRMLALLAASQAANTAGFVWEMLADRRG